ncbi:MAG: N-acetylmuramoyl-L-alanine amidase [Lachnospiraceae bacterium]|nr:N-acetylmuramoyl-L-alanine amidase [Lachnospiraceae bacterium]
MAIKIMIDAGHGGYDNGASYEGRREKDDVLRLAFEVGGILEGMGYDVEYTRVNDVYESPVQKAREGNNSGADFFVSLHRNSSANPNQYNGVETLIYDDSGIKADMAENINRKLTEVGYRDAGVEIRPNLAVLRRTRMPAILVEAGFINSDVDNELFDNKFTETAQAIADGIDETIKMSGLTAQVFAMDDTFDDEETYYNEDMYDEKEPSEEEGYQILTGIFRSLPSAQYSLNSMENMGYYTAIYEEDGLYQVRVGMYKDIEEALIAQKQLRDKGIETLIVRAED